MSLLTGGGGKAAPGYHQQMAPVQPRSELSLLLASLSRNLFRHVPGRTVGHLGYARCRGCCPDQDARRHGSFVMSLGLFESLVQRVNPIRALFGPKPGKT